MPKAARQLKDGQIALNSAVALAVGDADGGPPDEIEIILSGSYKGPKKFTVDEKVLNQVIANHRRAGVDPAVDREHESWFSFEPSDARGWVKALSVRPSTLQPGRQALVGKVEWTDLGRDAIAKKHQRYISAGLNLKAVDPTTGEQIGAVLDHVALVKNPYVQGMQALSLSATTEEEQPRMDKIAAKLGLAADADEAGIVAALEARDKQHAEALSKADADRKTLAERVEKLEGEKLDADIKAAVDAFKITPAEADEWRALGKENPERCRKMLAARPAQNPAPAVEVVDSKPRGESVLASAEKAIDDEMKADPTLSPAAAFALAAEKHPALFKGITEKGA